jgi:hypothetical protein
VGGACGTHGRGEKGIQGFAANSPSFFSFYFIGPHIDLSEVEKLEKSRSCNYRGPLQNPTLGVLVTEGGNVIGGTGLWFTEAKV